MKLNKQAKDRMKQAVEMANKIYEEIGADKWDGDYLNAIAIIATKLYGDKDE